MRTAEALQELHGFGYAHLDVRVPNICFSKEKNRNGEYDVKLIDLDWSTTILSRDLSGFVGEMYRKSHAGWSRDKCDWKQLGLLAARVVTKYEVSDEDIVKNADYLLQDQCLRELIKEGRKNTDISLQTHWLETTHRFDMIVLV